MAEILFSKVGNMTTHQRKKLEAAGVVVIEVQELWNHKFITGAAPELPESTLLRCAGEAIQQSTIAEQVFGKAAAREIAKAAKP